MKSLLVAVAMMAACASAACASTVEREAPARTRAVDAPSGRLVLHARDRREAVGGGVEIVEQAVEWPADGTAVVVVDMWDDHWCAGAARRVAEMAPALNVMLEEARRRGILVIHAPSSVVDFYAGTAPRERALRARPHAEPPVPLADARRWGTTWCWPDSEREPRLPIDDSDMGCDCEVECTIRDAWSRQTAAIRIDETDAITDDGQETYNLLEERGIDHVIIAGVHLNMCVLGRPFGIRQLVDAGKNVLLVRDLTDTMYDSDMSPFVDHFTGTDLVIAHVERFWCPSVVSSDLTGKPAFRFREDLRAR